MHGNSVIIYTWSGVQNYKIPQKNPDFIFMYFDNIEQVLKALHLKVLTALIFEEESIL